MRRADVKRRGFLRAAGLQRQKIMSLRKRPGESPSPVSIDGFELLKSGGHLLRRAQQRAVAIYAEEVGRALPSRQFSVLLVTHQNPGLQQTDLTGKTGIDRSTASDIVDRLIRRGYLRTRPDKRDQRAKSLFVTAGGKRAIAAALPGTIRVQERLFELLPAELRGPFIEALARVADIPPDARAQRRNPRRP